MYVTFNMPSYEEKKQQQANKQNPTCQILDAIFGHDKEPRNFKTAIAVVPVTFGHVTVVQIP